MDREQLLTKFAKKRATKISLTWAQFTEAVAGADATTKAAILQAANASNGRGLFTRINALVQLKKYTLARAEVDAVAADDSLTIDELLALLN